MAEWKVHLQRAIEFFGSQPVLAREIGCSQSKISWLLQKAEKIDAEDALAIERATAEAPPDKRVTKSQLRPDLWPSEPQRIAS